MRTITRKSEIKILIAKCLEVYRTEQIEGCIKALHGLILSQKVKFPLLEYCGEQLFNEVKEEEQLSFCDEVEKLKTEGGNVILGIILRHRLNLDFKGSIEKTVEYTGQADIWYVCDIIGERVFGYALLHHFTKMALEMEHLSKGQNQWVVRSLGAGAHYAIKKGLGRKEVIVVFKLLLSMANSTHKEIRQGIGWAAKTTAKFHPDIIEIFKNDIDDTEKVANWFRAKILIGLNRYRYAKRN